MFFSTTKALILSISSPLDFTLPSNISFVISCKPTLLSLVNPSTFKISFDKLLAFVVKSDHIAIRTSSYTGINKREDNIQVYGLNYVIRKLHSEDSLLIVDDVFDTGLSVTKIIEDLKSACKKNTPEIRTATPYFKPSNNQTTLKPNYFLHETDKWLVFPHELEGLSIDEIKKHKPELHDLIDKVVASKKND